MRREKLKALFFQEWKLTKKFYLSGLLACLILTALLFLVFLSLRSGTLSRRNEDEQLAIRYFLGYIGIFLLTCAPNAIAASDSGIHKADLDANWLRYSYAMPISPTERALSRFLFFMVIQLTGLLLSVIGMVISCRLIHFPLTWRTFLFPVAISAVTSIGLLLICFFTLRARDKKTFSVQQFKYYGCFAAAGMTVGLLFSRLVNTKTAASEAAKAVISQIDISKGLSPQDLLTIFSGGFPETGLRVLNIILIAAIPVWIIVQILIYLTIRRNLKRSVL